MYAGRNPARTRHAVSRHAGGGRLTGRAPPSSGRRPPAAPRRPGPARQHVPGDGRRRRPGQCRTAAAGRRPSRPGPRAPARGSGRPGRRGRRRAPRSVAPTTTPKEPVDGPNRLARSRTAAMSGSGSPTTQPGVFQPRTVSTTTWATDRLAHERVLEGAGVGVGRAREHEQPAAAPPRGVDGRLQRARAEVGAHGHGVDRAAGARGAGSRRRRPSSSRCRRAWRPAAPAHRPPGPARRRPPGRPDPGSRAARRRPAAA